MFPPSGGHLCRRRLTHSSSSITPRRPRAGPSPPLNTRTEGLSPHSPRQTGRGGEEWTQVLFMPTHPLLTFSFSLSLTSLFPPSTILILFLSSLLQQFFLLSFSSLLVRTGAVYAHPYFPHLLFLALLHFSLSSFSCSSFLHPVFSICLPLLSFVCYVPLSFASSSTAHPSFLSSFSTYLFLSVPIPSFPQSYSPSFNYTLSFFHPLLSLSTSSFFHYTPIPPYFSPSPVSSLFHQRSLSLQHPLPSSSIS